MDHLFTDHFVPLRPTGQVGQRYVKDRGSGTLLRYRLNGLWVLLVMVFLFLGTIIHSFVLRRVAIRTRRRLLDQLREKLRKARSNGREKYRLLIEEVERQDRGAFQPLTDDFVFRALAIPFGGTGGLLLINQLLPALY